MATDRAADVRIRGNAPAGGRNAFNAAEQARVDAATRAATAQVSVSTAAISAEEAARRAAQEIENARIQRERTDWIEQLRLLFANYGLESLAPKIQEYVQAGFSPDTVTLKLQDTPEYQQRFSGNAARKKAGLPVLSPAEYLATESAYKQIMRTTGLPSGFYDNPDDFSNFIGSDVSPSELKSRVDAASLSLEGADPFYKDSLESMYGLTSGDMIAYVLDPQRSLPFINRRVQAVQFGAEARRQGLNVGTQMAETYAGMGVTQAQARTGFEQIAAITPVAEKLSQITAGAQPFGMEQTAAAVFGGEQSAEQKRRLQKLAEAEQSRFAGQAGVGQPSLGMSRQGQF